VTRNPATPRLHASGRQLWEELDGASASGGGRALILEACRIADRLSALDRLIGGDARDWLDIVESKGDPERQELVINAPLAEARQQAAVLKQLLAELRQSRAANRPAVPTPETGVPGVTSLSARIAARRRGASTAG
jgi:hypothetical protein